MAQTLSLLKAKIFHGRLSPKIHQFNYELFYLCIPLKQLRSLPRPILSLNKFNILSFHEKDYGPAHDLNGWIHSILSKHNLTSVDGEIVLITLPRVFGYAFNPVNFWFCLDQNGHLRAVLSQVNNTFGERHCYLSFHEDQKIIQPEDHLISKKVFHVSPFFDVTGTYEFRFQFGDTIGVWINHFQNDKLALKTSIVGTKIPMTSKNLLRSFFQYPLETFKVIYLIHYHALLLILKGIRHRKKPPPPKTEISL